MYVATKNMESESPGWLKNKPALVIVGITVLLIGFEAYAFAVVHLEEKTAFPDNIGNFERIRTSLREQGRQEKFSFAVVGEVWGNRTFERLCDDFRNEPLSFMVILGDFVENCSKSNHDFFRSEAKDVYWLPFPVFLVVGDHDVVWQGVNYDIDNVSLADFEELYGPRNFSFEYNGCLFVSLCLLPYPFPAAESIKFLESTLARYRDENRRVFVFTHVPVVSSIGQATDSFENMQAFINVVDRYKVDYVISSRYDGCDRIKRNDTVYLMAGGGGTQLAGKEMFGGLYQATVLTVDRDSVSERNVFARYGTAVSGSVKHFAMVRLAPFLKKHPALTIVENFLVFSMFFVSLYGLVRSTRRASLVAGPRMGPRIKA